MCRIPAELVAADSSSSVLRKPRTHVQLQQVEEVLTCLDDTYLNKHLIFQIVELIIVRLVPELGERGVRELLEERTG